jgi:hypothetical protein
MPVPKTLSPANRGDGGEAQDTISFGKRSILLIAFPLSAFKISLRAVVRVHAACYPLLTPIADTAARDAAITCRIATKLKTLT